MINVTVTIASLASQPFLWGREKRRPHKNGWLARLNYSIDIAVKDFDFIYNYADHQSQIFDAQS